MSNRDQDFLRAAIEESRRSIGPHKFGAVLVLDEEIVAQEHNIVREIADPSAHAELTTIRAACQKLGVFNLPKGCTLYASHEPCLMCFCCAAWAEIDRIVFATPASEQDSFMYEFKDVNIFDIAKKLNRPVKVEHIKLHDG